MKTRINAPAPIVEPPTTYILELSEQELRVVHAALGNVLPTQVDEPERGYLFATYEQVDEFLTEAGLQ